MWEHGFLRGHCWHNQGKIYYVPTHNGLSRREVVDQRCCGCPATRTVNYNWDY